MKISSAILVVTLVIFTSLAGCLAPGLFSTKAPWDKDWGKRPDGSVYARDTERNWQLETRMLQQLVDKEIAAAPPPLNKVSWSDYWAFYFNHLHSSQENPEKYITFILELRRKAGLPDVPKD